MTWYLSLTMIAELENLHSSLVLVEEFSEQNCLDTESCAQLKSNRIAEKSCYGDKKKVSSKPSQSGMMCEPSTESRGVESWIASLRVFRVNHSRSQASDGEPTTNGTCGLKQSVSLAKYDLDTRSWRTFQGCLFQDTWGASLEIFPNWGMIAGGELSGLMMSEHRTDGNDCGFVYLTPTVQQIAGGEDRVEKRTAYRESIGRHYVPGSLAEQIMWTTPTSGDTGGRNTKYKQGGTPLSMQVRWPSPKSRDYKGMSQRGIHAPGDCLPNAVAHGGTSTRQTYPTPKASDGEFGLPRTTGRPPEKAQHLATRIAYPTPKRQCANSPGEHGQGGKDLQTVIGGQLNPSWVEWLMGWPIGWTDLKPLVTGRFHEWLEKHGIDWAVHE